jgi:LAS superfamily LD-carboxypeptidase LdcB
MPLNELELTGRARTHVVDVADPPCVLHRDTVEPFLAMRAAAHEDGLSLTPLSAFRDFDRQLHIWNDKFGGHRPVYDRVGHPVDHSTLDAHGIVDAILAWSALPGASRHHWGSEIDLIDRAALAPGRSASLLPAEYAPGGPFARLNDWLTRNMARFDFFRPYTTDRGGVAPEPWHLSYAPVSEPALQQLTEEVLRQALSASDIAGKEVILARLPELHCRFVLNIDPRL